MKPHEILSLLEEASTKWIYHLLAALPTNSTADLHHVLNPAHEILSLLTDYLNSMLNPLPQCRS
jgi:hypothetical protein